jgi:hypothetical protein
MRILTVRVASLNEAGDVGVICSTSAHEYLVNVLTGSVATIMIDDGLSGDSSSGSDDIVR